MSNNFVSLRPRLQNVRRAPQRAADALVSDMGKRDGHAGHLRSTSHHVNRANRVQKIGINAGKRKIRNGKTLTDRFGDTIDCYRTELVQETDHRLAHTKKDLDSQLSQITKEFSGSLKIVAEYEDKIFKPVSEERLEITDPSPEKGERTPKEYTTLADRMRGFEKIVAAETACLDELWKEWHATNLGLACLAMEVLGPEGVEMALNEYDNSTAAQMNAAVAEKKGHEARDQDVKDQAAELEIAVRTIARETINNLNEQEKEWKINEKKKIQKIKQIMMEAD